MGGHSCPSLLKLVAWSLESDYFEFTFERCGQSQVNVEGGGQECPPHTCMS